MTELVALHGTASTLVVECPPDGAPLWRWWGPRLPDDALPSYCVADARYVPPSSLEQEVPATLLPTFGVGGFGQPALLAHRAGLQFAQRFDACKLRREEGLLEFDLRDTVAALGVVLSLRLDEHDVLRVDVRLTNDGDTPLALQWLASATLPLPAHARCVRSAHGQWANEFRCHDEALGPSTWLRENHRGRTAHDGFPGALVLGEGAGAHAGTAWGAQLAWSGNSRQCIAPREEGGWAWQLGEWLAPGEVLLAPGAAFQAPQVVAACSTQGTNGSQQHT
ncbi:MAG: glycoside hydrolase family 36 N-terminal domain-containing protein [Betaproteobacteria bacterium]